MKITIEKETDGAQRHHHLPISMAATIVTRAGIRLIECGDGCISCRCMFLYNLNP